MVTLDFYEYFTTIAEEDPSDHGLFIDPMIRYTDSLDIEYQLFITIKTMWESIAFGRSYRS